MMQREGNYTVGPLIEFIEDSPVLEPVDREPTQADLDRWAYRLELMLESDEPWMRRDARCGLTTNFALKIKALLVRDVNAAECAAAADAVERLRRLKGRIAEPAELEALVESLMRAIGSDRDRAGHPGGTLRDRYPDFMASEFGPLVERLEELADPPA